MNGIWQNMAHLGVSVPILSDAIVAQATGRPVPRPSAGRLGSQTNWNQFFQEMVADFGNFVPKLLGAIAILVLGWIAALIGAAIVRGLLNRTNIDNKLANWITGRQDSTDSPPIEKWISDAVFWVIFIFTLVAFLQTLGLTAVSTPLNTFLNQIFEFLPSLAGALIWLGIAWLVATISKLVLTRTLRTVRLDDRLNQQVGGTPAQAGFSLSQTLANALYWFIFLLFLPPILEALGQQQALAPDQNLLDQILTALPKILTAVVIGAVGWLLAQVVRQIVTNLLAAAGTDRVGARFGLGRATTGQSLSWILGTLVYVLILIPTAIAVLNALAIEAISRPAVDMLNQILNAIPKIFTAGLILVIAYAIGRFVADLVSNILTSMGFDNIFDWIGLGVTPTRRRIIVPSETTSATASAPTEIQSPETPSAPTNRTPSEIVGIVALVGILLLAIVPATEVLQFAALTAIVSGIVAVSGRILAGLVVFAIGLYLANLAFNLITSSGGQQARILGHAARIAIIALVSAMALQQMGIASDIVNLAFGLLLGAIAVAIALAFGLGSRDIAASQVREWLESFKEKKDKPPLL